MFNMFKFNINLLSRLLSIKMVFERIMNLLNFIVYYNDYHMIIACIMSTAGLIVLDQGPYYLSSNVKLESCES